MRCINIYTYYFAHKMTQPCPISTKERIVDLNPQDLRALLNEKAESLYVSLISHLIRTLRSGDIRLRDIWMMGFDGITDGPPLNRMSPIIAIDDLLNCRNTESDHMEVELNFYVSKELDYRQINWTIMEKKGSFVDNMEVWDGMEGEPSIVHLSLVKSKRGLTSVVVGIASLKQTESQLNFFVGDSWLRDGGLATDLLPRIRKCYKEYSKVVERCLILTCCHLRDIGLS